MKNILVVAEKNATNLVALNKALALARSTGAAIELVGFVHENGIENSELLNKRQQQAVKKKLLDDKKALIKTELAKLVTKGVKIKTDVVWEKSVHDWIISRCKASDFDLVVKSGHRSETMFYTPTDWHLIRSCPTPVLITSSKSWAGKQPIVAAVDLNTEVKNKVKLNKRVIEFAKMIADCTAQPVKYVFTISLPRVIADLEIIDEVKLAKEAKAKAAEQLKTTYAAYNISLKDVIIRRGDASKVISKAAKQNKTDLVVMGTIGRKGIRGKLIGNTAESVLSKLQSDVLAVKV